MKPRTKDPIESFRDMWPVNSDSEAKVYRVLGFDEDGFPILIPWFENVDHSWWDEEDVDTEY